jgi:hypothetical protein
MAMRRRFLIAAVSLGAAAAGVAATGTLVGAAPQNHGKVPVAQADKAVPAASVNDVISQVQAAFGDGIIQSAAVSGTKITINAASPEDADAVIAGFEAAVLAHAVADWQVTHGQTPITSFAALQANGEAVDGMATEAIGGDASASPLPSGTCETGAQQTPGLLVVADAATLPFAGGSCVIKVQTSGDPDAAAAAVATALSDGVAALRDYLYLIEVEDASGSPQLIFTWVPGVGTGPGEGSEYVRPGIISASHG